MCLVLWLVQHQVASLNCVGVFSQSLGDEYSLILTAPKYNAPTYLWHNCFNEILSTITLMMFKQCLMSGLHLFCACAMSSIVTSFKQDDIIETFRALNMVKHLIGQMVICATSQLVEEHMKCGEYHKLMIILDLNIKEYEVNQDQEALVNKR